VKWKEITMNKEKQIEQGMGDTKVIIRDTIYSISNEEDRGYLEEVLNDLGYHKQSKWISVEERLPEPNVGCIVAAKVGNIMVTDFAERVAYYNLRTQETTYAWEIMHDWDEGEGCEITHWMPLPQPPKMKGADDEG
jgi:hypothetical protein